MKKVHLNSFLLGAIAVLLAVVALQLGQTPAPVLADSASGGNPEIAAVSVLQNGNNEILCVIDKDKHMAVYQVVGRELKMLFARNLELDLRLDYYNLDNNRQDPTVKEVQKLLEGG